jgi:pimeloyl-ACP methyl ester carboxylesterase
MLVLGHRAARDSRLFNTVVRYNMRGAHNSVAKRNWNVLNMLTAPEADPQDLVAVCDYVLKQLPDPPLELFLVGYSYGSTVAASALQQVPEVGVGGGGGVPGWFGVLSGPGRSCYGGEGNAPVVPPAAANGWRTSWEHLAGKSQS